MKYLALSAGAEIQFPGRLLPVNVWDFFGPGAPGEWPRGRPRGGCSSLSPGAGGRGDRPLLRERSGLLVLLPQVEEGGRRRRGTEVLLVMVGEEDARLAR